VTASVHPARAPPGSWVELRLVATVADTWHVYGVEEPSGLPTSLALDLPQGLLAGGALLESPAPTPKTDPNLGPTLIHKGQVTFTQKVQVFEDGPEGSVPLAGELHWQACDPSDCLPGSSPFEVVLEVDPGAPATGVAPPAASGAAGSSGAAAKPPEAAPLSTVGLFLASIGFGLAMLVMPCTYPMIPITVSLFSKGTSLSRAQSMVRAGAYAGGIVVSFVLVGGLVQILFASAGQDALNSLATNAWVNLLIGGIFVYFAFSFFGYYELGLPAPLMRLMQLGQGKRDSDGTVPTWSLFLMGLFFVLTAYTCGAPVIFSLFATAASVSPVAILGSTFVFAVTVALPFFALALVPGGMRLLPKSGSWFTVFKVVMGFVELGFAVKFFRGTDLQWDFVNLLPRSTTLGIWTLLALCTALYLHGYFPVRFPHQPDLKAWSPKRYAWGWLFVVLAGYFGYGAAGHDLNSRVEALVLPDPESGEDADTIVFGLPFHKDLDRLEAAKARARETGTPAFLMFTGHYCPNCVQMEKGVLPQPEVVERLEKTGRVALFIDKADDPAEQAHRKLMLERYNPSGSIPAFFVIDAEGAIRSQQIGSCSTEAFVEFLQAGGL
jgi:thiol:disulfide interchange protein DsbD